MNDSFSTREFDFVGQVYDFNLQCVQTSLGNRMAKGVQEGTRDKNFLNYNGSWCYYYVH